MSTALLVADSGPLIALARLGRLDLPSRLFGLTWVTATVWDEVTRLPRPEDGEALTAARQAGQISVVPDPTSLPDALASALIDARLDAGERSAIALALIERATVLMDERRGRASALALGLPTLGTLGLLVRARDAGLVDRVRPLIDTLVGSGYFLAKNLVERTLADIGE